MTVEPIQGGPEDGISVPSRIGRTTGRYLLAIRSASDGDGRVSTGTLQDRLDVAPASVTEKVGALDDRGLVDHENYRGVALTTQGREIAAALAWRVCVVTRFFEGDLGANLDDRSAFGVAVTLPVEGIRKLRERTAAGCIETCPEAESGGGCCPA